MEKFVARKTGKAKQASSTSARDKSLGKRRDAASASSAGSMDRTDLMIAAAIAVVTVAVYAQVAGHQFISLDDDLYIVDNAMVNRGLTIKGIAWAFSTFHAANWHPLAWLSHMTDCWLFGLNAGGHLLVNSAIHILNSLLVFVFLKRATGARWPSALVAALFALHPLHVESVAWAAERKDTLAAFFGLLCLVAYESYVEAPSRKRYLVVTLTLAFGLMAKPMLVTWPLVLLLVDYWPLRRIDWQPADGIKKLVVALRPLVVEKIPLFLMIAGSMVVTYLAQARGGAVAGLTNAPVSWRVSNAAVAYAKYLIRTFWATRLGVYYPFSPEGVPVWQAVAAVLLLAGITVFALRESRRRRYLIVGWLWFLGTLVPVIGLVQVGGQAMADRYHYLPSIGLFVAIVFGVAEPAVRTLGQRAILAAVTIVLVVCCALTAIQVSRWRNSETLFEHTLSVTSDNLVIQYDLGHVLGKQGRYDEALAHFAETLRVKPDFFDGLINTGFTLSESGRPAEAVGFYNRALEVQPGSAKAHQDLGLVLVKLDKKEEALQEFYRAKDLAPGDAGIRTNLGLMLGRLGRLREAADQLNDAIRLNPNSAEAHNNLGLVLMAAGKPEESIAYFATALRLKPDLAGAQDNLRRAQTQISGKSGGGRE
jgi:Flp pilus assembly protein TadD